jgi:Leucine rich repeat
VLQLVFACTLIWDATPVRIDCSYVEVDDVIAGCFTTNVEVKFENETITSVSGTLSRVIDYANIKIFKVEASPKLEYIPSGVEKFFPKLEQVIIKQTALRALKEENLKNLHHLRILELSENKLDHLEEKVFKNNKNIEMIDLSRNSFKSIDVSGFKFTPRLRKLDFSDNDCIQGKAETPSEVEHLLEQLIDACPLAPSRGGIKALGYLIVICILALIFLLLLTKLIKFTIKNDQIRSRGCLCAVSGSARLFNYFWRRLKDKLRRENQNADHRWTTPNESKNFPVVDFRVVLIARNKSFLL